jgi:transposase
MPESALSALPIHLPCALFWNACGMITIPSGTHIWVAAGITDMRRGFDGPTALVQTALGSSRSPDTSSGSVAAVAT